ncbi:hypothetical protein FHS63_005783 [Azospirillum doebereinerae]
MMEDTPSPVWQKRSWRGNRYDGRIVRCANVSQAGRQSAWTVSSQLRIAHSASWPSASPKRGM